MKQENIESMVKSMVSVVSKDRSKSLSFMALCAAMSGEEITADGYTPEECLRAATHLKEYQTDTGADSEAVNEAIKRLEAIR